MQSIIRFSLFGNFEKFSTNNLDLYMKLIDFFGKREYKPATANELQLQPNGQSRVLIMPNFLNEMMGTSVEITSNRINFIKNINNVIEIEKLGKEFTNNFFDFLDIFVTDMSIMSNRLALNCDIFKQETISEMPTLSRYYDDVNKIEMSVRNVARKEVENEQINIIIEKYATTQMGLAKYSYDINSIAENQAFRFDSSNIHKMYDLFIAIAVEIEEGLK